MDALSEATTLVKIVVSPSENGDNSVKIWKRSSLKEKNLLQGRNPFLLEPPEKGVHPKRKEFAPLGNKFFPFRADPFSEGTWCAVEKTWSHKNVSLVKKGGHFVLCTQRPHPAP